MSSEFETAGENGRAEDVPVDDDEDIDGEHVDTGLLPTAALVLKDSLVLEVAWLATLEADGQLLAIVPHQSSKSVRALKKGPVIEKGTVQLDAVDQDMEVVRLWFDWGIFSSSAFDSSITIEEAVSEGHSLVNLAEVQGESLSVLADGALEQVQGAVQDALNKKAPVAPAAKSSGKSKSKLVRPPAVSGLNPSRSAPERSVPPGVPSDVQAVAAKFRAELAGAGVAMQDIDAIGQLLGEAPSGIRAERNRTAAIDAAQNQFEASADSTGLDGNTAASLSTALMRLAEVMEGQRPKVQSFEATLDGMIGIASQPGSSSSSVAGSGSRRNAAARLALRRALYENPEHFSNHILKEIRTGVASHFVPVAGRADFAASSTTPAPARLYLQSKAAVGNHRPTAFWSWGVAGALECLTSNRTEEAKARLCLLLAAADQLSLDHGNLALVEELMMEDPPPYGQMRQADPSIQQAFTPLMDPRWGEVCLSHIKDMDGWLEVRKRLASGKRLGYVAPTATGDNDLDAAAAAKAKAKGHPRRPKKPNESPNTEP